MDQSNLANLIEILINISHYFVLSFMTLGLPNQI